jgi:hypothetical protein
MHCDKRVLLPHPTHANFCDQYLSDETTLGVIGQLGVNGPHYALAAKRFCPVRLSTAAHFLKLAHTVLFPPLFTAQRSTSTTPKSHDSTLNGLLRSHEAKLLTPTHTSIKGNRSE